jgi:LemA protein
MGYLFFAMVAAFVLWAVLAYNRLVRHRNQVRAGWADIDVQLTRRHDLVPPLVEAVRGYARHEASVLASVTALRNQAMALSRPDELAAVEGELERGLSRLFALREAYPELKSNQNFLQLQRDLVEVEEHLQYARRFYNGAVRQLNDAIQRVPDVMVARLAGFQEGRFYSAAEGERAAPVIGEHA